MSVRLSTRDQGHLRVVDLYDAEYCELVELHALVSGLLADMDAETAAIG